MAFRDWLRNQQEQSEKRKRLFEGGTSLVPASQAWGGYQDRPGGQRLMTRQMTPPPASVTLTEKNDGTRTKVTKWEPDKASRLKVSGIADEGYVSRGRPIPPPRNQRNPLFTGQHMYDRGRMSPEMQAAVAQVQATGGQNVDAYGDPINQPNIANLRAMHQAQTRPRPQVVPSIFSIPQQTQQNIWGSRFVPNPAPMIRKERNAPPVGMDEEQWRFLLDRIHGGNY